MKNKDLLELFDLLSMFKDEQISNIRTEEVLQYSDLALSRIKNIPLEKFAYLKDEYDNFFDVEPLFNHNFLESKYFGEDLNLIISNLNRPFVASSILKVANSEASINSSYHLQDINMIANSDISICGRLAHVAQSEASLNSSVHEIDMKTISEASENNAYALSMVASNEVSLENIDVHLSDMEIISNQKENIISANSLAETAINKASLSGPYHFNDMMIMSTCDNERCLFSLEKIATSKESINSPYHFIDMMIISECTNAEKLHYLSEIATNEYSLKSPYHVPDMSLVANMKSYNPFNLYELAISPVSLSSPFHYYDMEIISKVDNRFIKMKHLMNIAKNITSLNSIHHPADMKIISQGNEYSPYEILESLACSEVSLNDPNHQSDMELLVNDRYFNDKLSISYDENPLLKIINVISWFKQNSGQFDDEDEISLNSIHKVEEKRIVKKK